MALIRSSVLARAGDKSGGNITIHPDAFLASPDSVVSASSVKGVSGQVVVTSSDQTLVGSLTRLPGSLLDVNAQLRQGCAKTASGDVSTFVQASTGGLPPTPGGWLPSADSAADGPRGRHDEGSR